MKVTVQDVHKALADRASAREMRRRRLVLVIGLALGLAALSLAPVLLPGCYDHYDPRIPEPEYPYGSEVDCASACSRLAMLGCPEGAPALNGQTCVATCEKTIKVRPFPLQCWADAGDIPEARACGGLRCR